MSFQPSQYSEIELGALAAPNSADPVEQAQDTREDRARRRRAEELKKQKRLVWLIPLVAGGSILILGAGGLVLARKHRAKQAVVAAVPPTV